MHPWWVISKTYINIRISLTPDFWTAQGWVYATYKGQEIKYKSLSAVLMCINLPTGPFWCRWAHHSERAGVQAGQWGSERKSIHLRPHSRWRLPGKDLCFSRFLFVFTDMHHRNTFPPLRHIWRLARSSPRLLRWSRWHSRRLREPGLLWKR